MKQPELSEVPLSEVLPLKPGALTVTMSRGQWDATLAAAYAQGCVLLELDDDEKPRRAYQRGASKTAS